MSGDVQSVQRRNYGDCHKKLTLAAFQLSGIVGVSPKDIEALIKSGADQSEIDDAIKRGTENPELCLLDHEKAACDIYARCSTQWRRREMDGALIGLDYTGVRNVAEILSIDLTSDVFTALQLMESAIVSEMQKRARHNSKR